MKRLKQHCHKIFLIWNVSWEFCFQIIALIVIYSVKKITIILQTVHVATHIPVQKPIPILENIFLQIYVLC